MSLLFVPGVDMWLTAEMYYVFLLTVKWVELVLVLTLGIVVAVIVAAKKLPWKRYLERTPEDKPMMAEDIEDIEVSADETKVGSNLGAPFVQQPKLGVPNVQQPKPVAPNVQQPKPVAPNVQQPKPGAPKVQQPNPGAPYEQQPNLGAPNLQEPNLGAPNLQQPNLGALTFQQSNLTFPDASLQHNEVTVTYTGQGHILSQPESSTYPHYDLV